MDILRTKCENSIKKNLSKSIITFESLGCSTYSEVYNLLVSDKENVYVKMTGNGIRFTYHGNVFYIDLGNQYWVLKNDNGKKYIDTHQDELKIEGMNLIDRSEPVEKQDVEQDKPVEKQDDTVVEKQPDIFSAKFWKKLLRFGE